MFTLIRLVRETCVGAVLVAQECAGTAPRRCRILGLDWSEGVDGYSRAAALTVAVGCYISIVVFLW